MSQKIYYNISFFDNSVITSSGISSLSDYARTNLIPIENNQIIFENYEYAGFIWFFTSNNVNSFIGYFKLNSNEPYTGAALAGRYQNVIPSNATHFALVVHKFGFGQIPNNTYGVSFAQFQTVKVYYETGTKNIFKGIENVTDIKLGTQNIESVFLGNQLLVSAQPQFSIDSTNPYLWYDISQLTGLSDGQSVQTLTNLRGPTRNAIQNTTSSRPIYRTNRINGKPILEFNGSSDFMKTVYQVTVKQPNSYFIVYRHYKQGIGWQALFDSNASVGRQIYNNLSNQRNLYANTDVGSGTVFSNNFELATIGFNFSNTNLRINGNSIYTTNVGNSPQDGLTLSARFSAPTSPNYGKVDFAEFIAYDRLVTGTERTNIENYLINKYGL